MKRTIYSLNSMRLVRTITTRAVAVGLAIACLVLGVNAVRAQNPVINNVYPDGAHLFESSATLSFNAVSSAGVSNLTVQLTATKLSGGSPFLRTLTSGHGLTVTGPATNQSVSTSLSSNRLYTAVIQVIDVNSNSTSTTVNFDTITPSYTFEAEDFDYTSTNGSGLFIDNPQTNAYAGLSATQGVDCQHDGSGNHDYRPNPPGLGSESNGDVPRVQYMGTGKTDYDIGWNNGGDFGNYTRHYPPGLYNVYIRGADGGGASSDSASLTVNAGTATFAGSGPYTWAVPPLGGWQTYSWVPLKDSGGNLAQLTIPNDGTASTLRVTIDQGNMNANFYMLMPADTNAASVSDATITNIYPDGTFQFQATNSLTFNIVSTLGVNPNDLTVQLGATNLSGTGSSALLSSGSGLTVSGPSTNLSVSIPLTSNIVYTAFIQVVDANGNPASITLTFDTITPAYTFEAEDFDYGGGRFIDNPQTNAYTLQDGVSGIDFINGNPAQYQYNRIGLSTETCGDVPRLSHVGFQDYDLGNAGGGNWGNYTRTYPAGTYNIFLRAADGNGTTSDSCSLSLVTSGWGGTNQSINRLGTFSVPASGGWQKYEWVPLKDNVGNLVQFTGGSTNTLRLTTDNGNYNANLFLLMPADTTVKVLPHVDNFVPDGSALFQYTNQLSFAAHSQVGITTNNIVLNLDGVNVSGMSFSGGPLNWNVTCPVKANAYHTAIITLTDSNGTASSTNSFGTFSSSNYQWEVEDYDYTNGLFIDNPQVNAYANLNGTSGVDFLETDTNVSEQFPYRPFPAMPTTTAGDLARDQFTAVSGTDYNIGFFGGGSWCNYTRHYPLGTYNVLGRFAEGASATEAILSLVTGGFGTTNQTKQLLGTFNVPVGGWSSWEWVTLKDTNGNPVKVTFTGATNTIQLGGSPVNGQPEVNVNFLMLVPTPPDLILTATVHTGVITISYPTGAGVNYQVQYKQHITDTNWNSLGSPVPGTNGVIQSMTDNTTNGSRFYRVKMQ